MTTKETHSYIAVNLKREVSTTNCSCYDCDSIACFAKRFGSKSCSCNGCKSSKTCLFYTNEKVNFEDSNSNNSKTTQDKSPKHSISDILANECDNNNNFVDNYKNILSKNLLKTGSLEKGLKDDWDYSGRDNNRNISFPQVHDIPLVYSHKDLNSPTGKLSAQVMNLPYNNFRESISRNQYEISSNINKIIKYDIFKRLKEVYKACSCKVCECIVGKSLSIKKDFCKCKPCDCDECTKNNINQSTNNTVLLTGCPCVRCANSQCKGIVKKFDETSLFDGQTCDCVQCADSFSKPCDCKPCECVTCKSMFLQQPNTVIVAPVGEEHNQQNACQCQPCDCIHCGGYGFSSRLMHEMSTELNRHQNCHCEACIDESCIPDSSDTCKCERRNRVMRKPVQRDTHDYDIRHAIVTNNISRNVNHKIKDKRQEQIAMFAALTDTYPKFAYNKKICDCNECECIVCQCENNTVDFIKSSQLYNSVRPQSKVSKRSFKECQCSPCECQICVSRRNQEMRMMNSERSMEQKCGCDTCDCLNCDGLSRPALSKSYGPSYQTDVLSNRTVCKCDPCECTDCKLRSYATNVNYYKKMKVDDKSIANIYPIKRGKLLTPSMIEANINDFEKNSRLFISENNFPNSSVLKSDHNCCSEKRTKSQNNHSVHYASPERSEHSISKKIVTNKKSSPSIVKNRFIKLSKNDLESKQYKILKKYEMGRHNKGTKRVVSHCSENKTISPTVSHRYMKETLSFNSLSKATRASNNTLPLSLQQAMFKSDESSCNSSGYDCQDYLIRFPPTTVQKCIDDVINADLNNLNFTLNNDTITNTGTFKRHTECFFPKNSTDRQLYITTILSNKAEEIKHKQTSNLSIQADLNNTYDYYLKSNNKLTDRRLLSGDKENRNIEIVQTNQNQTHPDRYQKLNTDKNLTSNFNKHTGSINRGWINLSDSELPRNHNRHLNGIYCNRPILNNFKNQEYPFRRYTISSVIAGLNYDINYFRLYINYERIQKALQEVKAFSTYLEGLLKTYEKADAEFVSISEKLKSSHNSLFNGANNNTMSEPLDKLIVSRNDNLSSIISNNALIKRQERKDSPIKFINKSCGSLINQQGLIPILNTDISNQNNLYRMNKDENKNDISLNAKDINETIHKRLDYDIEQKNPNVPSIKKIFNAYTNLQEDNKSIKRNSVDAICGTCFISEKSNEIRIITRQNNVDLKKSYRKYRKLLKSAIIVSKKFNVNSSKALLKTCIATETSNSSLIKTRNFNQKTQKEKFTATKTLSVETNNTELEQLKKKRKQKRAKANVVMQNKYTETSISENQSEKYEEEIKTWPIYKKNFNLTETELTRRHKVLHNFPTLDVNIKDAVRDLGYQINAESNHLNNYHENKALAQLLSEVKKLSDMPILQRASSVNAEESTLKARNELQRQIKELLDLTIVYPVTKKCLQRSDVKNSLTTDVRRPTVDSNKSIGDPQKVSFLGLRRVSDHTVLVKWNPPRVMTHVQGYELFVDGRTVQKIINPTKCMAVVTCLPHTEKILVTIKTIVSSTSQSTHFPSSSIVYKPRIR